MNKSKILLTGIIPFTSVETLMKNSLSKIQEFPSKCELILVHDSSTKLEDKILCELRKSSSASIKYICEPFRSPGLARNAGLKIATGNWIAFWDSDDLVKINRVIELIEDHNEFDIVIGGFTSRNYEEPKIIGQKFTTSILDLISFPGIWRYIFKREILAKLAFNKLSLGEDILFLSDAREIAESIYRSSTDIYEYRISGIQTTRKLDLNFHLEKFLDLYAKKIAEENLDDFWNSGVFWRQVFSYIRGSEKRTAQKILGWMKVIFTKKNWISRMSFIASILFAFNLKRMSP